LDRSDRYTVSIEGSRSRRDGTAGTDTVRKKYREYLWFRARRGNPAGTRMTMRGGKASA